MSVLLGNGSVKGKPSFAAAVGYSTGTTAEAVAVADFDGDGKADLGVAGLYENDVSLMLGNGDGTFASPVNYQSDSHPVAVASGDFDGVTDATVSTGLMAGAGSGAAEQLNSFRTALDRA